MASCSEVAASDVAVESATDLLGFVSSRLLDFHLRGWVRFGEVDLQYAYRRGTGAEIGVTIRPGSFNINEVRDNVILTCDGEGRPLTIWRAGRTIRRSYSGEIMEVWRAEGARQRRTLSQQEFDLIWGPLRKRLGRDLSSSAIAPDAKLALRRAVGMSPERLRDDADAYLALYGCISIMPPDAYLALPLQIHTGCPYGRCSFCSFYKHRPFAMRTVHSFKEHVERVLAYFGSAVQMRSSVFLSDANALVASDELLMAELEIVRERLPNVPISCFGGPGMRKSRTREQYQKARDLGLQRISIGIESGSPDVLELLNKPGDVSWWRDQVSEIKAAGIHLGLIVLVGAGGSEFQAKHIEDTVRIVSELELDNEDLLYLSPLTGDMEDEYSQRLSDCGSGTLQPFETELELTEFKRIFRESSPARVSRYDIRDFFL